MFKQITRTVWIISLVSLFNDFSSEMLYPIIPLYLSQIGYGSLLIGFIEGIAECLSGLTKIYMGSVSDNFQKRLPFIQFGYLLSILSRPLIGLSSYVALIVSGRSMDRIGKGIRSGARDAMLGDECSENNRAEIFGFHRSMDTFGAILGPLIAIAYLHFHPNDYRSVFLITILPGLLAVAFTFNLKDKKLNEIKTSANKFSIKENFSYLFQSSKSFKQLLIPLFIFSLINSSDMFLLLRAKEIGVSGEHSIFLYLLFNLVYALTAFPLGKIADKLGALLMLKIGLIIYMISYLLFANSNSYWLLIIAFCLYGLYYAFTQGIIKSLIIERINKNEKAKAIGLYEGLTSFGLLIANSLAGLIWYSTSSSMLFYITALLTFVIIIYLVFNVKALRIN
jgi:MFS family permease